MGNDVSFQIKEKSERSLPMGRPSVDYDDQQIHFSRRASGAPGAAGSRNGSRPPSR